MRWWCALALVALGCDGNGDGLGRTDSESHWLEACAVDGDCTGGLSCECGFCTTGCAMDEACAELGGDAVCRPLPTGACGAATLVCTSSCDAAADCGDLACVGGFCAPESVQSDAHAGDAMVGDGPISDGPVSDGEVTDGSISDGPVSDGPVSDGPVADGALPDVGPDMGGGGRCGDPGSTCGEDDDCGGVACAGDAVCMCDPGPAPEVWPCPNEGQCCDSSDCVDGDGRRSVCMRSDYDFQDVYCGGPEPLQTNNCVVDACTADHDCGGGQVCVRAGQHGFVVSRCIDATCRVDADCVARAGGRCTAFFDRCYVGGFHCSYDGDPCRVTADCPQRGTPRVCVPREDLDGSRCIEDIPAP